MEHFLAYTQDELHEWIKKSIRLHLSGGYDKEVAKAMIEQEILWWIEENEHSIEAEKEIFEYMDRL